MPRKVDWDYIGMVGLVLICLTIMVFQDLTIQKQKRELRKVVETHCGLVIK